ncbi:hypothetical protein GCM10023194_11060 [Planotetraspora phitsanulokensis]|uniref:Uncharacterized protein n=1 Tax=Planotetraspora phitsanulokensis TaxID=575192 RepID=A0A8J3U958_9ACTN|nr:hypothetical protein [Planotetraspora phitsanulokensis]GII40570.1 hypothetical protein Pph01_55730 [Planotetraspora phitsanulokensis]
MGYPGDQHPHRPPFTPPDPPSWRDAPPHQAEETSSPYGGPHTREPSPFETGEIAAPYGTAGGYRQDTAPYGAGPGRQQDSPFGPGPGFQQDSPFGAGPGYQQDSPFGAGPGYQQDSPFGATSNDRRQNDSGQGYGDPGTAIDSFGAGPSAPPPGPPPPPEPKWDPDARVPLWRRPLVFGIALVALIAALFAGLWVAAKNDKPTVRKQVMPTPTIVVPSGPGGKFGYAESRATDKSPLSVKELFGKKKITLNKHSYQMTVWRTEKKCADGISGAKITKALKAGSCTQMIRASFRDAKGSIIGTIGVANLKTSSGAKKVASAGGGGERTDYLKPLPGKDSVTKNLGSGEAYAGGWTHGHYTVLLWFQFKDGHKPSKTGLKQLYQAAVDITDATVFPALETRSLTGGHA